MRDPQTFKLRIYFPVFLFLSLLSTVQPTGATDISACTTISSPGDYVLIQNISATTTCITITTGNITLDCQEFTLTGDRGSSDTAIYLSVLTASNNTISNCNIRDFGKGIVINQGDENTLENISVYNSYLNGIELYYSSNNSLSNITVFDGHGGTAYGISLSTSDNNTLNEITTKNNTYDGIYITSSDENKIYNSTSFGNTRAGIMITSYSLSNVINNLTAYSNAKGIYLNSFATNGSFSEITEIYNNSEYDLYFKQSEGNFIKEFNFTDKSAYSDTTQNIFAYDLEPLTACGSYSWTGFSYELGANITTTGTCISIEVTNTSFDCKDFTLTGDRGGADYAIYFPTVTGGKNNISNCNLQDFGRGIYATHRSNLTITNITINNSYASGIEINTVFDSDFTNMNISDSHGAYPYGISITSSDNNTFTNIKTKNNSYDGIYSYLSDSNNFYNITSFENGGAGMYFYSYSRSSIIDNLTAYSNTRGIYVYSYSTNNSFSNINISNNSLYELYFKQSEENTIDYFNFTDETVYSDKIQNLTSYDLEPITICGSYSWTGLSYELGTNISTTGTCITLETQNISFNCKDFILKGDDGSADYGITLPASTASYINISNCNLQDFGRGINLQNNYNNRIGNISINSSTRGIYSTHADNSTFQNISINNSKDAALEINNGLNNILSDITITNTNGGLSYGLAITTNSNNNTISNVNTRNNSYDGIYVYYYSDFNKFYNITSYENGRAGMYFISYSKSSTIDNLTAYSNDNGISLSQYVSNNTFSNVKTFNNTNKNVFIIKSQDNIFYGGSFENSTNIYGADLESYPSYFNTSSPSVGNYYNDISCLANESRKYAGFLYDVCINPANYTINSSTPIYDLAPLASPDRSPAPVIPQFESPTYANGYLLESDNWTVINTSADEIIDECTLYWDSTPQSMTVIGGTYCFLNKTDITNGTHNYYVEVSTTTEGISNGTTETRELYIGEDPQQYLYPTPMDSAKLSYYPTMLFQLFDSSGSLTQCTLHLNGTEYEMNVNSTSLCSLSLNVENFSKTTYTFNISFNNNFRTLESRTFSFFPNPKQATPALSPISLVFLFSSLLLPFFFKKRRKENKKATLPAVATVLLLFVVVVTSISTYTWVTTFRNSLQIKVDNQKSGQIEPMELKQAEGNKATLALRHTSTKDSFQIISSITLDNSSCLSLNGNVIDTNFVFLLNCSVLSGKAYQVAVYTNNGIYEKSLFVQS
ncbi:right-handed parallel beta-helix repeat-containing protein [Candidatus Woesearchaeota archaeon]|nr:right-handed parallel beta-helix repeat-containing protein [Candidatus Woesearchaeota archaeon]